MISLRHSSSCGRNSAPTAYSPGAGNLKPSSAAFLAKNLCGICTRMPAPSPARGSAPTAPRCSRLTRIVSASSTILCDLRPLISAINPTPQESFSSAGSNRPKPDPLIVVLALRAERLSARSRRYPPCAGRVRLRVRAIRSILEATFVPRPACGCFFAAARRALVHRRLTTRVRGSPIGTAMLSYAEHGKFPTPTQGFRPSNGAKTPKASPIDADFPLHSAPQVDHGGRGGAMVYCTAATLRATD